MIKKRSILDNKKAAIPNFLKTFSGVITVIVAVFILMFAILWGLAFFDQNTYEKNQAQLNWNVAQKSAEVMGSQFKPLGYIEYYGKTLLGFNAGYREAFVDFLVGFFAGLIIFGVQVLTGWVRSLLGTSGGLRNKWLLFIAGNFWQPVAIGVGFAAFMQVPVLRRVLQLMTFELLGATPLTRTFILALEIGFFPAWIEGAYKSYLRMKGERAIIQAKTSIRLQKAMEKEYAK